MQHKKKSPTCYLSSPFCLNSACQQLCTRLYQPVVMAEALYPVMAAALYSSVSTSGGCNSPSSNVCNTVLFSSLFITFCLVPGSLF